MHSLGTILAAGCMGTGQRGSLCTVTCAGGEVQQTCSQPGPGLALRPSATWAPASGEQCGGVQKDTEQWRGVSGLRAADHLVPKTCFHGASVFVRVCMTV